MTLVSEDEAEPIHSAIVRKEAWTQDAVRRLRADADRRMKEGPWTVTSERPKGVDLDPHDYYSEAPYWWPDPANPSGPYLRRDGEINPDRFTANRAALNSMCDAVFSLGAAAFCLDDTRYAQRAARVVNTWFINPKTRMNPSLEHAQAVPHVDAGRAAGILDGRVLVRAVQGIDERGSGNNHASWWTVQAAAVATFVGDDAAQQMAFNYYRDRILPSQIRADGSAPREEARTRSLSYSAFNLEALAMLCRIAQAHGTDLWTVRARNGAGIGTVIDYLEPYLADPRKWSKEQVAEFQNGGLYFLAFAGMGLKKPEYVALFRKLEHPEGAWLSFVDLMVGRWEAAAHQTRH
jgi:hypothetical protein